MARSKGIHMALLRFVRPHAIGGIYERLHPLTARRVTVT